MWSGSISLRRTRRWFSASMKKAKFKPSTRTQPGLPMKKGRAGTMTHDYKRAHRRTCCSARRWTARSSGHACHAIGTGSSALSQAD